MPVIKDLNARFNLISWNRDMIHDQIKNVASEHNLKLPKIAMPLRVMVTGITQTPSIDLVLELLGRKETLKRIEKQLKNFPA